MNRRRLSLLALIAAITVGTSVGFRMAAGDDDDDDEKERATSFKAVPDAVKATILAEILREVKGLELDEIVREKENGKTVYEVEIEYKNKDIELEIAANGKLLDKEVERDDDDDDSDDDDDDDD